MARGQRKTIDDKIREKEELIAGLKKRMQAEEKELAELKRDKRDREMDAISRLLMSEGVSVEEARSILEQHLSDRQPVTA